MTAPTSFTERDLHIVVKGMQHLLGDSAQCHVCKASAPASRKDAGVIATGINGKLTLIPFCAEHRMDVQKLFPDTGPMEIRLNSAQILPAYLGYIEHAKQFSKHRYFIVHPLSAMVPEAINRMPMVMIIDQLADKPLIGIAPCPLTDAELAEPFFIGQGELAAECLEALNQVKAGKRRYSFTGGLLLAESDEPPVRIENPIIQEMTK